MSTFQDVATEFNDAFESSKRDDDTTFYKLKNDAPEWLQGSSVMMAIHAALDDRLPDDWVYKKVYFLSDRITDKENADDARDTTSEWADSLVDTYNSDRSKWLASHLNNAALVDEAVEEYGTEGDTFERIGIGQYLAIERIAAAVIEAIETEANDR